jgi:hypothetical protein
VPDGFFERQWVGGRFYRNSAASDEEIGADNENGYCGDGTKDESSQQ